MSQEKNGRQSSLLRISVLLLCISTTGCFLTNKSSQPGVELVAEESPPPAGTVRYCWEEPKVIYEPNGPGVDAEGRWYHPDYLAVREAKMGRYVPCRKGQGTN